MELTLARPEGEAPSASHCCHVVPLTSHPQVVVEAGPLAVLDAESAEDLHYAAQDEGRSVDWVLFHCFRPGLLPFGLTMLAGLAVAFPVRVLTKAILPAYFAAASPLEAAEMLPLGLEPLAIPTIQLARAFGAYTCFT